MRDMNIDEQSRGRSWSLARSGRGLEKLRDEAVPEVWSMAGERVFVRISGRDARAPVVRHACRKRVLWERGHLARKEPHEACWRNARAPVSRRAFCQYPISMGRKARP
jgi:hypothetical protein